MKDVVAIVVTYNRKEFLKKCINALLSQEEKNLCDILVIDNASTDGTKEDLNEYVNSNQIIYRNTERNIGGAGGFNFGVKEAIKLGYKYMWLMDDDCIVYNDSLKELLIADEQLGGKYGFLSSVVLWRDGTACNMNKQKIKSDWYKKEDLLKYGLLNTYYATFVSFFIRSEVVKEIGLPIKEFFIWGDDVEYTNRISKKFDCFIVGKSQVLHDTKNNEGSNIARDEISRLNRYKYAYRNEMYIAKKNGLKGVLRQLAKIGLHLCRVLFKNKNGHRLKKCFIIIGSSIRGIFFNPKVEYVKEGR